MKLNKIATATYSFKDAVVSSVYNKTDKTFLFTIERMGFYTATTTQKNILVMSNEIENIYNNMTEVVTATDIDDDLTEAELALAEFIRTYNPDQEEVVSSRDIGETQDKVLIALNEYLATETEEDYSAFIDAMGFVFSQELAE